jgi:hypothetical protein
MNTESLTGIDKINRISRTRVGAPAFPNEQSDPWSTLESVIRHGGKFAGAVIVGAKESEPPSESTIVSILACFL